MSLENINKSGTSVTIEKFLTDIGKVELQGLASTYFQRHFKSILRTLDMPHNPIWPTVWNTIALTIINGTNNNSISVAVLPPNANNVIMRDLVRMDMRYDRHDYAIEIEMEFTLPELSEEQRKTFVAAIEGMFGFTNTYNQDGKLVFTHDIGRAFSNMDRQQIELINKRYWRAGPNENMSARESYRVSKFYSASIRYSHAHRANVLVFVPDQPECLLEQLNNPDFFRENLVKVALLDGVFGQVFATAQDIPFQQPDAPEETVIHL